MQIVALILFYIFTQYLLCGNFVGTVWEGHFLFQHDCALAHKARSKKTWLDEVEWRLQARPSRPISMPGITKTLLDEWAKIPTVPHFIYIYIYVFSRHFYPKRLTGYIYLYIL